MRQSRGFGSLARTEKLSCISPSLLGSVPNGWRKEIIILVTYLFKIQAAEDGAPSASCG